jgi:hypothetical protein
MFALGDLVEAELVEHGGVEIAKVNNGFSPHNR